MNLNDYIKFDDSRKQFEIVTGTQGKYSYDDVIRVSVLNEKAKYKGKGIPFTAVLPGGPLPYGLVNYYPSLILLNKVNVRWVYVIMIALVDIIYGVIGAFLWQRGLKRYNGSGS